MRRSKVRALAFPQPFPLKFIDMKKFFLMCFVALLATLALPSCDGTKPEFKFDLELAGDVSDTPTQITADFHASVTNVPVVETRTLLFSAAPAKDINSPEGADALKWLDEYIQSNVIAEMGPQTSYNITVKGYVHEKVTGLTFAVDKQFTNTKPAAQ